MGRGGAARQAANTPAPSLSRCARTVRADALQVRRSLMPALHWWLHVTNYIGRLTQRSGARGARAGVLREPWADAAAAVIWATRSCRHRVGPPRSQTTPAGGGTSSCVQGQWRWVRGTAGSGRACLPLRWCCHSESLATATARRAHSLRLLPPQLLPPPALPGMPACRGSPRPAP